MPCHLSDFLKVVMVLSCGLLGGLPAGAQDANDQAVERYRELVVEVLEARLQAEVVPEGNRVRLRTSPNRLLKTMRDVVRASAPYYFEGGLSEFRRFSARVTEGVSALDGQTLSAAPRGWSEEDWRYYEVERAIQDVMILIAMDVGVYANGFLSGEVRARSDLARDWEDLQGGSDPLRPEPLPDFGAVLGTRAAWTGWEAPPAVLARTMTLSAPWKGPSGSSSAASRPWKRGGRPDRREVACPEADFPPPVPMEDGHRVAGRRSPGIAGLVHPAVSGRQCGPRPECRVFAQHPRGVDGGPAESPGARDRAQRCDGQ